MEAYSHAIKALDMLRKLEFYPVAAAARDIDI